MNPTPEQRKILNAKGRIVKINARAGTGKTATLLLLAEANSDKKILYLVFNSRNRLEAKSKFPSNVEIHTIHSFALSTSGGKFDGFEPIRASHFLQHFRMKRETLSTLTQMFLVYFLNSAHPKLEEATEHFNAYLSDELKTVFESNKGSVINVAREALSVWYKDKKKCPHDFYLKMSHHQKKFQNKLGKYDLVLVDEGQDLSPIMLDALMAYKGRIVLVGDTHQQIYSFRYAEDAMRKFSHDELYDLTLSFRFGPDIARLTTQFIRHGKEDDDFEIAGERGRTSRVYFYEGMDALRLSNDTAILCRSNFSLFKNAMYLKAKKREFRFERDISADLYRTLDVYWLSVNEKDRIKDELIQSFETIEDLKKYAETIEDYQLLKMAEIVDVYSFDFPDIVYELLKLCKEKSEGQAESITLSTIHASKGQEYDNVVIDDDIVSRIEGFDGTPGKQEEINVAYVGITRTKMNLYLPIGMKTLFTEVWQNYVKDIPTIESAPVRAKGRVQSSAGSRKVTDDDDFIPSKKKQPYIPPEIKVGDKVKAPNGYGHVVDIRGDEYLVALENQKGRVWEKPSALVKVQIITSSGTVKSAARTRWH